MFGHLILNMKDSSAMHALIRARENMDTSFVHPIQEVERELGRKTKSLTVLLMLSKQRAQLWLLEKKFVIFSGNII